MATLKSFLCLLLLSVSVQCSPETLIPFIAWSNGDVLSSLSSKQPSTIDEFLGGANLKDIDLFVIFKTSKLSFDDIAKYGGVYGEKHSALSTLQSQLQSSQSTLWTGMQEHPATILTSSLTFNYDLDPQDVLGADDISPSRDGKQLIVVLLPDDDSEERAFLEQGKVISAVMSAISSSQKSFIAFYTSDSSLPSGPQIQVFEYKRQAENIFDESDSSSSSNTVCALVRRNTTAGVVKPCAMMCLTTPFYMVNLTQSGSIDEFIKRADDFEFGNGVCGENGTNAYIEITVHFVNDSDPMTFQFSFLQEGSYQMQNLNVTVPNGFWTIVLENDDQAYIRNTQGMIYSRFEVPIGTSYACGNNSHNIYKLVREKSTKNSNETNEAEIGIQFSRLQAQIGGKFSETSFASAYNCESYLSHISLMGIFSVLILLVILYCSTVFMFQMKTMDRFDDPRGPTISVENLH